jgi:transposase
MTRKKYSLDFKMQVVKEIKETGSVVAVARRYDLSANMLSRWVREMDQGKYGAIDYTTIPQIDPKEMAKENDQLKRLLGEKDLEIAILRDLIKKKNPHLLKNLK